MANAGAAVGPGAVPFPALWLLLLLSLCSLGLCCLDWASAWRLLGWCGDAELLRVEERGLES